ncbi:winged helix-turn-helix domain-containing protein [Colwelliaceae bacterium 6471]
MRYLQCQDIEIDTQNQVLNCNGEVITLAPKVYELLLYFCLNSQRVISKDELMEHVWAGTLVTENAITRTLVKVRKALGDDPKSPQFIVTAPRKGYRMLQSFVASDDSVFLKRDKDAVGLANSSKLELSTSISTKGTGFKVSSKIILGLLVLAYILFFYWPISSSPSLKVKQIKALTREVSQELFPTVSPDLNRLAYTKITTNGAKYLVIENLKQHEKKTVQQPDMDLSKIVWSYNNEQVAFLSQSKQSCVIYLASLSTIEQTNTWEPLTNCSEYSNPHFLFSPDGKSFLFNDRLTSTNGYQIFKIDLKSGQKEIVNQPITVGKGNYSFDVSPNGEYLVMLNSEFEPITAIYTLNFQSSVLKKTGQLDYLMRSVAFNHDSQSIVHPSPHPAYELWQSTLSGEKLSVVASNTSRVKHVQRLNNNRDFVFVSYLLNRDLVYQADGEESQFLEGGVAESNSSVMDYLPTLANKSNNYAFVSKRTSNSEVYFVEEGRNGMKEPIKITNFEYHVKLYDLTFSPSDQQLLILADNQLFIADINTKHVARLPLSNRSIQAVSWQNEERLLFTTIRNNNWQVSSYHIATETLTDIADGYYGGIFIPKLQLFALVSQQENQITLMTEQGQVTKSLAMNCHPAVESRQLNLHLIDGELVCFSQKTGQLVSVPLGSDVASLWRNLPARVDFSANNQGIIYTKMSQSIADVMRTVSE